MKTLSLIVLVLSFAITTPAMAKDSKGGYETQGVRSCGEWVKNRKEDSWPETVQRTWVAGYITAYNMQTPDVYSILGSTDLESALLWMDKYCQENPLKDLTDGMQALIGELWQNRKRIKDD